MSRPAAPVSSESPDSPQSPNSPEPPLAQLLRWEASGAHWRVLHRPRTPGGELELALLSCDAGEEMARLRSADPALAGHVGDRDTDQD